MGAYPRKIVGKDGFVFYVLGEPTTENHGFPKPTSHTAPSSPPARGPKP